MQAPTSWAPKRPPASAPSIHITHPIETLESVGWAQRWMAQLQSGWVMGERGGNADVPQGCWHPLGLDKLSHRRLCCCRKAGSFLLFLIGSPAVPEMPSLMWDPSYHSSHTRLVLTLSPTQYPPFPLSNTTHHPHLLPPPPFRRWSRTCSSSEKSN